MRDTCQFLTMGPIRTVKALPGGVLRVCFYTGSVFEIPIRQNISEPRLCPLREEAVWNNVTTDRQFVRWNRDGVEVAELSWQDLVRYAVGAQWV